MVEQASTLAAAVPSGAHPVHLWFRPLIAQRLTREGTATLGALRAKAPVARLRQYEATLGVRLDVDMADVDSRHPMPSSQAAATVVIGGTPSEPRLTPLSGSRCPRRCRARMGPRIGPTPGSNRATSFSFIRSPHDLAAIHAR
ncbi:integrase [Caballeronia arationis]|nr:integrase [Caballeronia arationis]